MITLPIYKISSTCFGQSFAHLQERKTDILQHVVSCCGRQGFGERQRDTTCRSPNPCLPQQRDTIPYAVKYQSYAPEDGQNIGRNMLS